MDVFSGARFRGRRGIPVLLFVLVLTMGLLVSGIAAVLVERGEQRYAGQVMDRYADDVAAGISAQVGRYSETLSDLASAVGAQSTLLNTDFARLSSGLNATRLPGTSGVAFVVPAATGQVGTVQALWRAHGAFGLRLRPSAAPMHDFVIFDRSFDGAAAVAGLDLGQSPATDEALQKARRSGALAVSAAYVLLRDRGLAAKDQQTSVVLAAPVYAGTGEATQAGFTGWVVMGLRGTAFLTQTLQVHSQGAVRVVLDDPAGTATTIAGVSPSSPVDADDRLARERTFSVGQRSWHVSVYATTRLLSRADRYMGLMAGVVGAVFTALLAVLVGILAGSRSRALERVERATTALRDDIEVRKAVEFQLREREEQLRHLAFHDALTGLANRILFYDRVSHALLSHARVHHSFAVFFIDLDGFKQVNDRHGHAVGDAVLVEVARRLRRSLRDSDTVARFGGDEFAVLAEHLSDHADAQLTAQRIVAVMQQPIDLDGATCHVTASVGIALNHPGDSADDILREADMAMYTAKTTGKSRYVLATTPG